MMTDAERMEILKKALVPGAIVGLKSGGPQMTVDEWRGDDFVTTQWFDGNILMRDAFHPFTLFAL